MFTEFCEKYCKKIDDQIEKKNSKQTEPEVMVPQPLIKIDLNWLIQIWG